ncbi:MAG: amidohydrolase [candidate division WOR-3 bacterium]|nr:amidohydrolase [candidate division WOR-3 bacterium]
MEKIVRKAFSIKDYIIKIRRELHSHPELSFEEKRTHQFIERELKSLGLEPRTLNKTGITADIGKGDERVGLRADMDALPIKEENNLPYKSQNNGFMHACGHDTHMAMLLGAAKLLINYPLSRPVRLIFQPSEEKTPGGAKGMIREGALEGVSEIYGLHIDPEMNLGSIKLKPGVMMAAGDEMDIIIKGVGGHASEPSKTIDPIYASSLFINEIEGLIGRRSNSKHPIVISICSVHGGSTYNIIPSEVKLKGTVRTIEKESWRKVPDLIKNVLKALSISYGINFELSYKRGYPIVKNDLEKTEKFISIARNIFKRVNIMKNPLMGSEDFSYYLEEIPGTFAFIGGGNKEKGITSTLHSPEFLIDEDSLPFGSALFYLLVSGKTNN